MSRLPQYLLALGLLAQAPGLAFAAPAVKRATRHTAVQTPAMGTIEQLERDTTEFAGQTASITNANECFPVPIRDQAKIGILWLYCSDAAQSQDGESVRVSDNFKVPDDIARRYNFWRRVYSLWGKDQYVMHLSEYPEVVVEAYDVSHLGEDVGPVRREIMVKKVAKSQREFYRKLFLTMHKFRNQEDQFTPAMQRLARIMGHIKDKDKYLVAYRSLRLQRGQRDFIANGLAVAPKYLPAIEAEFKAQGIPVEISRLAFVESSFNLKACSKVGASGVYQIMPATGRQYLKMFGGIDERNDPVKASRAAAKLLHLYHDMTGSWPLAITAYNHGVGGIRRAIRTVGSNDIIELINHYRGNQFGFASKNFYASFLGVLATLKDSPKLFPQVPQVTALAFNQVRLPHGMSIRELKKKYSLTLAEVQEFNPDISYPVLRAQGQLPKGYVFKVPSHQTSESLVRTSLPPSS